MTMVYGPTTLYLSVQGQNCPVERQIRDLTVWRAQQRAALCSREEFLQVIGDAFGAHLNEAITSKLSLAHKRTVAEVFPTFASNAKQKKKSPAQRSWQLNFKKARPRGQNKF